MVKFSVVIPVYKVEAYLDQCIESVLAQTYPYLEAVLVDDGSPDRSGIMCEEWAVKDRRVRVEISFSFTIVYASFLEIP